MSLTLLATVLASETAPHSEGTVSVNPIWFGVATFVVFLILIYGVTRLDLDR